MDDIRSNRRAVAFVLVAGVAALAVAATACKSSGADDDAQQIKVDKASQTVVITAAVAEHKEQDTDNEKAAAVTLEYLLVADGGKTDKSALVTKVRPEALRKALVSVGLEPGKATTGEKGLEGPQVRILVQYEVGGKKKSHDAGQFVATAADGKRLDDRTWIFTGSRESGADGKLAAETTGSIVGLHSADASSLIQNARPESGKAAGVYRANGDVLPKAGTEVRVAFQRVSTEARRVHVFLTGRVQGVGFRNFVAANANKLKLTGWVRNLNDGRVEAVVEGPAADVASLLKLMERGPSSARVTDVNVEDEKPTGEFDSFKRKPNA